jgi:hypothetical protein
MAWFRFQFARGFEDKRSTNMEFVENGGDVLVRIYLAIPG